MRAADIPLLTVGAHYESHARTVTNGRLEVTFRLVR